MTCNQEELFVTSSRRISFIARILRVAWAFPGALMWASPHVRARARRADIHFTWDLAANASEDWVNEIDQTLIRGGLFKEYVFFHKSSRTLILADTVINLELDKIAQP